MSSTLAGTRPHAHGRRHVVSRLAVGAISGIVAGIVFAMMAMAYAWATGDGLWAPPRMIGTIAGFEMGGTFAAMPVMAGMAIHMMLSAGYGAAFALVAAGLQRTTLIVAGIVAGLALYVVNFHVMARFEPFTTFQMMAGNWFEILIHAVYGLLLVAGIVAWRSRDAAR